MVLVIGQRCLFRTGLVSLLATMGFGHIEEVEDFKDLASKNGNAQTTKMLVVCLLRRVVHVNNIMDEINTYAPLARTVFIVPQLDISAMSGCFAAGASGFLVETISLDALGE